MFVRMAMPTVCICWRIIDKVPGVETSATVISSSSSSSPWCCWCYLRYPLTLGCAEWINPLFGPNDGSCCTVVSCFPFHSDFVLKVFFYIVTTMYAHKSLPPLSLHCDKSKCGHVQPLALFFQYFQVLLLLLRVSCRPMLTQGVAIVPAAIRVSL